MFICIGFLGKLRKYTFCYAVILLSDSNKKIIHIRGRHTWDTSETKERSLDVFHVVVSKTMDIK